MSEDCLTTVPSDRAVEQALVALKKGAHLLKYGRRGKPKFCPFRLSTDEKILIWYSDEEERQLRLSSITKIIRGQKTTNFLRQLQPERESQSFSIIYANGQRSLDLICKDKAQADSWCLALRAVVSKSHHATTFVAPKIPRATQSCVSSPAGYIRRKRNLGLLEETIKFSQVGSLSGCSPQSNSQRRSSDDFSCSSHSFYSESSLSSMQNVTNILNPDSPSIEADTRTGYQTPMHASVGKGKSVLRDVFIWGEGVEGGYLGGLDKFPKHNGMELDALSPKQLDSTMTLDVHKISLGAKHAALVTKEGEVFCWGDGNRGRLGNKVNMDVTCPKIVDSLSQDHVKSVVCGEYRTCAVTFSGELYTWGENFYNANIVGNESYPNQWLSHKISGPLNGVNVSLVACGEWHMAILSTSGQLFTYGNGIFGVLGHGDLKSILQPREVKSLKGLSVKSVACGPWHTAAIVEITADHYKFNCRVGKLFTWGDGDKGRLGHADQERKLLPTCVKELVDYDFTQVACGITLTAAVTHRGKVFTIGSADHGQLGNPRAKDKSITIVHGDLQNEFAVEISIGSYHIAVLTLSGSVYTWGKGSNGQLGLGDSYDRNCPTLVKALRDRKVESITCGYNLTAVICLHKSVSSTDQTACKGCGLGFSFTRKKHNCYNCGLLFCHSCSSKKTMDASLAPSKSKYFRVCNSCFCRLKGNSHSNRMTKLEDQSPRLFFTTRKRICDENVERGQAIATQCQMTITKKSLTENNQYHDSTYSFLNGIQRWGKVSCPVSFKSPQKKNIICEFPPSKNQISSTRPVCSQQITSRSQCPTATAMNEGFLESGNILTEEVQKLRAEVERLLKLCQTRSEKIKKYKQRTEETWSRAKEEAEKSKAAKEVIKVLTLKLRAMSENSGKELKDQTGTQLSQITSNPSPIASPAPERMNTMIVATYFPCQVGKLEDIKVASLCNSPVLFSNTLKSLSDRDFDNGVVPLLTAEELRLDSRQNGTKTPKKIEWVEKYEPGVYITFTSLPSRQKDLKRVRFSRKRFTEKEAEKWWEENEKAVYNKYEIEGYTSFNQDQTSG